jgi:hypothetical protein
VNSGRCSLLDNVRLISQLCSLERRTTRSGKDSVDHSPGAHDDVANAACGALVAVGVSKYSYTLDHVYDPGDRRRFTIGERLLGLHRVF